MNCFCTTSACPYPVNCYHRHHRWKWQFCNFSWKYISFLYLLYFLFFSIAETGKAVNRPGRHICPWAFLGQPGRLVGIFTLVHIYSLAGCWGPPGISAVVTPIIPASWIITRKSTTKLYVCSHFFLSHSQQTNPPGKDAQSVDIYKNRFSWCYEKQNFSLFETLVHSQKWGRVTGCDYLSRVFAQLEEEDKNLHLSVVNILLWN